VKISSSLLTGPDYNYLPSSCSGVSASDLPLLLVNEMSYLEIPCSIRINSKSLFEVAKRSSFRSVNAVRTASKEVAVEL
jgi:hypothetical protein